MVYRPSLKVVIHGQVIGCNCDSLKYPLLVWEKDQIIKRFEKKNIRMLVAVYINSYRPVT